MNTTASPKVLCPPANISPNRTDSLQSSLPVNNNNNNNNNNTQSITSSMSNLRIGGDVASQNNSNAHNNPSPGNALPHVPQSNLDDHQLLYNVLNQLTRRVQERDQLNEVLEQENVKLKLMLMSALDYCYSEMGDAQNLNANSMDTFGDMSYLRKNSSTDINNYQSPCMNVLSSNSSSRKSSMDEYNAQNSPRERRDSHGMNISPRQQAEMMSHPLPTDSFEQYAPRERRRSNTNQQYQHLENYVMGRKSSQPQQDFHEQPSYEMPIERPSSTNVPYQLDNYVMPTKNKRTSQPQIPQQQQPSDVYRNLQNYVMPQSSSHQNYQSVEYEDSPAPIRRNSAVPLENYVMPTHTVTSPYHNLDNYVMGGYNRHQEEQMQQPIQPQLQQQEPYRRSSQIIPSYITTPQQQPQQTPFQPQSSFPQGHPQFPVTERKRSTSNGQQYPLEDFAIQPPHGNRQYPFAPPGATQNDQKFFNMHDQYRRASIANFPPSSKHVQRQQPQLDPVQRSVDMFNVRDINMLQQQPVTTVKRMSGPTYIQQQLQHIDPTFEAYIARRQSANNEYSQQNMITSKRSHRHRDERRQSYGNMSTHGNQASPPGAAQPALQVPTPQPIVSSEKVFGNDTSMIPARRSSVIYTPGPSPKEIRQQQQREQLSNFRGTRSKIVINRD
jgi:hypothetical protein